VILILGSEGEGVSRTISQFADHKVVLPPQNRMEQIGQFPFNMIDSLNVGVSAALFISHLRNQIDQK